MNKAGTISISTKPPYRLLHNGEPIQIKGAGMDWNDGHNHTSLVEAGGNAFRTWRTDHMEQELAIAQELGLWVAVGIDLGKELHGFDYFDKQEVAIQFDAVKEQILKFKDHPNVLCWVLGNELNLLLDDNHEMLPVNEEVYKELNKMVQWIHEADPNHPVTTTVAGIDPVSLEAVQRQAPDLDYLSFQVYGELNDLPSKLKRMGNTRPYMVTEYGPLGHWEVPKTSWGKPIEESSAQKAQGMAHRIQSGLISDEEGLNMGSFVFVWGQKQERTPTWYGLFVKTGEADARVDEMTRVWTGSYPNKRAPRVEGIIVNETRPLDSLKVHPGARLDARLLIYSEDDYRWYWELRSEVKKESQGGAHEEEPPLLPMDVESIEKEKIMLKAPQNKGAYRLFGFVFDQEGKVGYANFPFLVI